MNQKMNKIVRATAGAGKTTGLLEAVYETYKNAFLNSGVYPKILLSTFTVKAANELTERLTKKAIEEKDAQFLNFVSSGFLEVGTLHSVFLKTYENIKEEGAPETNRFLSSVAKQKVGRSHLHTVLKEQELQHFIKEAREESEILDLFWHLYSYSFKSVRSSSLVDLQKSVLLKLRVFFEEFSVVPTFSFEDCELVDAVDLVDSQIDPALKKKKTYKDFVKFCHSSTNQREFLKKYADKNNQVLELFRFWKLKIDHYFESLGAFDISDVEVKLLEVLKENVFDKKIWDYCFFDEYQDTSPIQKEILDFISKKSINYFVGDPFQSIYFFRGARKDIFLNEFEKIEQAGGDTEYRLNNYRSANDIVGFSNGLVKFLVSDFMEMTPFHESRKGQNAVVYFEEGDLKDELEFVSEELKKNDYSSKSSAVLCRSVKELLLLARLLKQKNIAFKLSLSRGFESALETIEIAHIVKFIKNPTDDESFRIIAFSKWVRLSDSEIQAASEACKESEEPLWSVFKDHEGCKELSRLIRSLDVLSLSNALIDFIGESGFLDLTDSIDTSGVRERNVLKFLGALVTEEVKEDFNSLEFCDDVLKGHYRFESEDLSSDSGITLMTVHGSKGLQFDDVFLIGANKTNRGGVQTFYFGLDRHYFGLKVKNDISSKYEHALFVEKMIEEEKKEISAERQRLLYVAMTRAKQKLTLIGSKKVAKESKDPTWMSSILKYLDQSGQMHLLEVKEPMACQKSEDPIHQEKTKVFLKNTDPLTFADRAFQGVTQNLHEQDGRSESKRDLVFFSKAIAEGVLFHELIEKAKDLTDAKRLVPVFFEEKTSKRHEEALEYLFLQKDIPFEDIFRQGFREWGFDTRGEVRRSGKIDIWAEVGNTIWVVDYKTGALDNLEKGFEQLSAYKDVLTSFSKLEQPEFKQVLIFPYKKKTFIR